MNQKIIAIAVGFTLATFAAVGTFASQDGVSVLDSHETPTETPTELATDTPAATDTPSDATETPVPTDTPSGATETPTETPTAPPDGTGTPAATDTPSTDTPVPTDTAVPTATPRIHGIPDSNPVHTDDDGDGVCEKHETVVKTTPSGNHVRVPCHAGSGGGHKP